MPFKPLPRVPRRPAPAAPLPRAFPCPHCGVHAQQKWLLGMRGNAGLQKVTITDLRASLCAACNKYALWLDGKMIHPKVSTAPEPIGGLPDEVRADFMEARKVFDDSPRAAAALLRLSVQKLCIHLGYPGANLNDDIASLVADGLPVHIQKALDTVRVVGNNAVHPGELDLRDDPDTAKLLFDCVNWITDAMIQRPERIANAYARLPGGAKAAVDKRDGGKGDASSNSS